MKEGETVDSLSLSLSLQANGCAVPEAVRAEKFTINPFIYMKLPSCFSSSLGRCTVGGSYHLVMHRIQIRK